jgi:hypothetical protein
MSGLGLWYPDKESDKAERLNMSGLKVRHVCPEPLEIGLGARYV